jgi:hypothetical protein
MHWRVFPEQHRKLFCRALTGRDCRPSAAWRSFDETWRDQGVASVKA